MRLLNVMSSFERLDVLTALTSLFRSGDLVLKIVLSFPRHLRYFVNNNRFQVTMILFYKQEDIII